MVGWSDLFLHHLLTLRSEAPLYKSLYSLLWPPLLHYYLIMCYCSDIICLINRHKYWENSCCELTINLWKFRFIKFDRYYTYELSKLEMLPLQFANTHIPVMKKILFIKVRTWQLQMFVQEEQMFRTFQCLSASVSYVHL